MAPRQTWIQEGLCKLMADEVDRSIDYSALSLAAHLSKQEGPQPGRFISDFCEECEEEIPAGRKLAQPGCTLCISCAELAERGQGR